MRDSVEKFFWSDSPAVQALHAKFEAEKAVAIEKARAFNEEVGGEVHHYRSRGHVAGVKFPGRSPAGWRKSKGGESWPLRNTKEGKALYVRLESLRHPTANDHLVRGTVFEKFWCVETGGNSVSFPNSGFVKRGDDQPVVAVVRCRLYQGEPPADLDPGNGQEQYESNFVLPDGWHEWRKWEFEKFFDDLRQAKAAEVQP